MDGEHRIEQVRQADALRLGDEAEEFAVAVEAPGPALLDDLEPGFVVTIQQRVPDAARRILVGQFHRLGAEPLNGHDSGEGIRYDAADGGIRHKVFKLHH